MRPARPTDGAGMIDDENVEGEIAQDQSIVLQLNEPVPAAEILGLIESRDREVERRTSARRKCAKVPCENCGGR